MASKFISPFFVTSDGVYISNAIIENGTIGEAHIERGAIESAQIAEGSIETAKIGYAAIDTLNISEEAFLGSVSSVSRMGDILPLENTSHDLSDPAPTGSTASLNINISESIAGRTVLLYASWVEDLSISQANNISFIIRDNNRTSPILKPELPSNYLAASHSTGLDPRCIFCVDNPAQGAHRYDLLIQRFSAGATISFLTFSAQYFVR
jgi:hypothetical protein